MEVMQINLMQIPQREKTRIACIGVFDALHLAHQALLKQCFQYEGIKSFITFVFEDAIHIHKNTKQYLLNRQQRIEIVQQYGFDEYIEIIFDEDLKNLSPQQFVIQLQKLGIKTLICGFDFKFGKNREGDVSFLKQCGLFHVDVIEELKYNDEKIASSYIQNAVKNGDMQLVFAMLGRYYTIRAKVVEGKKLGRTIGYPTANLAKELHYYYPKVGVYYGFVGIKNVQYPAMISVGFNPTVETLHTPVIEAHILDFNSDIYGEIVDVVFVDRIRDEIKFNHLDELIEQLKKDEQYVRKMLCV